MTLSDIVKKRGNNNAPSEEPHDDTIGEGVQEEVHEATQEEVQEVAQEEVKQEPETTKSEEKQVNRLLNSTLEI